LFEPEKVSVISGFSRDKQRNVMAALANLAKYLGMYQRWQAIMPQAGQMVLLLTFLMSTSFNRHREGKGMRALLWLMKL